MAARNGQNRGQEERGKPEKTVDKTVGRVAETTASLTGDETLEAEGRPLGRTAQRSIYHVVAQPEGDESWKPERSVKS